MGLFNRYPLGGKFMRRLYRQSGMLYLPCDRLFGCLMKNAPVLMLIDTGTTANIMRSEYVPSGCYSGKTCSMLTAHGEMNALHCNDVSFTDSLGREYRDNFLVIDNPVSLKELEREIKKPVCGILGTDFMDKYGVIINFKKKEILF